MLLIISGNNMEKKLGAVLSAAGIVLTSVLMCTTAPAAATGTVSATGATSPTSADERFKTIHTKEWEWRVAEGLARAGDERGVSATIARVDGESQERRRAYWEAILNELDTIAPDALSPDERINFAVYRAQIATLLDAQRFREYEQPVNADSAFWTSVSFSARRPFRTADDYRNYLKQLGALPDYFAQQTANMRAGLARGFTPPRVTLVGRDVALQPIAEAATPQETVFFTPFKNFPDAVPVAEREALAAQAATVIREQVQPAYARMLDFFRNEYLAKARTTLAAERMPGGKDYYQSKIREFTTTSLTADQIHAIGLAEMAKIRAEMQDTMKKVDFKGDLPAFLAFLRTRRGNS